jgi:L-ascorbate metabolism protein UlaG (beta-lactamase superfamily)
MMVLFYFFIVLVVLVAGVYLFMKQKQFGKDPFGEKLVQVRQSSNYRDGAFQNPMPTDMMLKDISYPKLIWQAFNKPSSVRPPKDLPSVATDLKKKSSDQLSIIWFGHSSYLIKSGDLNILVDPVMNGNASPVSFFGKPFSGSDVYSISELPPIDILILTHDHYDHLHYESIRQLADSAKFFCTSLGVASHLEYWGVSSEKITEFDWWETKTIIPEVELTAAPARHFSGRTFKRGTTLWSSFALKLHGHKLFVGGDSGYGEHFREIGSRLGPFEIAILECGQYGKNWPYIHMLPEETVTAAKELNAKVLLPVHWAKFELAFHDWDDSIKRVTKAASENNQIITTPLIGEPVILNSSYPNKTWWVF